MAEDTPAKAEVRHQLFLSLMTKNQAAWGLKKGDGWTNYSNESDTVLPLWSELSEAEKCAELMFSGYSPECISLESLLNELLPALAKLGVWIGTNLSSDLTGIEVPADELAKRLKNTVVT